jgi:uncharacterized protein YaaQ
MELMTVIVQRDDERGLADALRTAGHPFTIIGTTGGFLRQGNATFLIGSEPDQIEPILGVIKENCRARKRMVNASPSMPGESQYIFPLEVEVGGAVVFIQNVERFEKF